MDFKVSIATIDGGGVLRVSVEGELEISTSERVTAATDAAVRAGCPLILDLSACPFIDSTGLRSVLHAHKALRANGMRMALVSDQPQVRHLLSLTEIELSVRVFDDLDQAIAWLAADDSNAQPSLPARSTGGPSLASPNA